MNNNAIDPDRWYEQYEEASVKQRYQMLLDIMQKPLSDDFLEETEMAELLITMSDELHSNNLHHEALTLIQLVSKQQPKFYKQEFSFYDKFLVEYYLYTKQDSLIENALVRFKKYPGNDVEQLFAVLDLLIFYDKSEIAISLCKDVYKSVRNNSQILDGAADEIAWVVVTDFIEKAYQQHQKKEEVDWQKFIRELRVYEYGDDEDWLEDVKKTLTTGFEIEDFLSKYKQKKLHSRAFYSLSTAFYVYMKAEKICLLFALKQFGKLFLTF